MDVTKLRPDSHPRIQQSIEGQQRLLCALPAAGTLWSAAGSWKGAPERAGRQGAGASGAVRAPKLFLHQPHNKLFALEGAPAAAHALAGRRVRVSYSSMRAISGRVAALSVLEVEEAPDAAAQEGQLHAGGPHQHRHRRLASDSLIGQQLSQLDLPGDARWLSPSVSLLVFIVDMCGKATQSATNTVRG